ncbi:MAG TPA: GNAT family N-acetyltransferase [Deinococcales bacterium]|nr:GNAT family N-acetyltransferase [Deinococcales bacterium]
MTSILETPYGPVEVSPCAPPQVLARLEPEASLKAFRPAEQQLKALVEIAGLPGGCVATATMGHRLIGYAAFHPPDPIERWSGSREPGIVELGAVETSPAHRGRHLARRLLETTVNTGRFDDGILIATLYHWHYDLEGTGVSTYAYRRLLERLYGTVGLRVVETDDPEIQPYPGNSLMARVGPRAPEALRREFERLRFLDTRRPAEGAGTP